MKKCVIIGSGLGGLVSGVILAKNGYDITILEQGGQVGGCLQCFYRDKVKFETGMHFIGSLDYGQTLNKLFRYLEILDGIKLDRLDECGYDVISLQGNKFKFANGKEPFIETLAKDFPKEKDNLLKYFNLIESISSASSLHSLKSIETDIALQTKYQLKSINEVIESIIRDPLLQNVLVGNIPLYAGEKNKTPFSTHAFITDFYNQSSFRVVGGSDNIAHQLVTVLKKYGGKVLTNHKVTKIICNDIKATSVIVNDSLKIDADIIISNIHPIRTINLLDTKLLRLAFRNRILSIPNTIAGFSVYLQFKENTVPYMNSNYYSYDSNTAWGCETYTEANWPKGYLYMHFCNDQKQKFANTGVILSYMSIKEMEPWLNTTIGKRGNSYLEYKKRKAELLICKLEKEFPNLKNNIINYYTSTPLTYRDYTGTEGGSMYGVVKDINNVAAYRVPHKTKIPNLFFTGQNINTHGMLGVMVGAIVTCSEMLTSQNIYNQIIKANEA